MHWTFGNATHPPPRPRGLRGWKYHRRTMCIGSVRSHSREGGSLDVPGLDDDKDDHDHDDGSSEASVVSPQRSREEGAASRTYDDANATCSTKPEGFSSLL